MGADRAAPRGPGPRRSGCGRGVADLDGGVRPSGGSSRPARPSTPNDSLLLATSSSGEAAIFAGWSRRPARTSKHARLGPRAESTPKTAAASWAPARGRRPRGRRPPRARRRGLRGRRATAYDGSARAARCRHDGSAPADNAPGSSSGSGRRAARRQRPATARRRLLRTSSGRLRGPATVARTRTVARRASATSGATIAPASDVLPRGGAGNAVEASRPRTATRAPTTFRRRLRAARGNDRLADFSTYGVTSVDLAAPGVDIYSTYYDAARAEQPRRRRHVDGGATWPRPRLLGQHPELTPWQAREMLLAARTRRPAPEIATGGRRSSPPSRPRPDRAPLAGPAARSRGSRGDSPPTPVRRTTPPPRPAGARRADPADRVESPPRRRPAGRRLGEREVPDALEAHELALRRGGGDPARGRGGVPRSCSPAIASIGIRRWRARSARAARPSRGRAVRRRGGSDVGERGAAPRRRRASASEKGKLAS